MKLPFFRRPAKVLSFPPACGSRPIESGVFLSFAAAHKALERAEIEMRRLHELGAMKPLALIAAQWGIAELRKEIDSEVLSPLDQREREELLQFREAFGHVQAAAAQRKVAALRCFVRGTHHLECLPKDIETLKDAKIPPGLFPTFHSDL